MQPVRRDAPRQEGKESDMTDDALQQLVGEELFWDPKVDSEAIAATAADGIVSLRGTVGSFWEKREAKKAAERVYGVTSVNNELSVDILSYPEDDELRGSVLKAMELDGSIPDTIDAQAFAGTVTLTGKVTWAWQRDEAEFVVGNVPSVHDVDNGIEVKSPQPKAGDVKDSIKKAFKRTAKLDADDLMVNTNNGTVTVAGTVSSWFEHDAAMSAAWAAPGVTNVEDDILVAY
jgi:osmotically-inducible protein OsmY